MVDRLRALVEEPLGPQAAHAVVVLSTAILLGLAVLFVLVAREPSPAPEVVKPPAAPSRSGSAAALSPSPSTSSPPSRRRQDPQDQKGSPAARRAARALESHRALQHVPFRSEALAVELVGARGHRALLLVTASTIREARQGWRGFLRRHRDSGRAYIPIFRTAGAGSG